MEVLERKIYGERIRQGRILRGLSQEQLAKQLDITRQAISNCEKNNINSFEENIKTSSIAS